MAALIAALPTLTSAQVFEVGSGGEMQQVGLSQDAAPTPLADISGSDDPADPLPLDLPADAITEIAAPAIPSAYRAPLYSAADAARVSPALLAALVSQESGWKADAVSAKGATGLAQLMPATARALGVNPRDPAASLQAGAHYLRTMLDRFGGDVERALAAYNAGPARVTRASGIPAIRETQNYVAAIIGRLGPAAPASQGSIP